MSSNRHRKGSGGTSVVVEIGNDWLKMIQAQPSRNGLVVSKVHLEKFASAGAELSQALARAVKAHKFAKVPVIAYLPRQVVNIKMLELPSTDPNEIADMVDLQAGKQTPYSKDEIVCDYRIVGSAREGYSKVMLVIVQRGVLRQRFSTFEDAGIEVRRMSVSSEGLLNWCRDALGGGAGGAVAVLDVDSFYSDLSVVAGGNLEFSRSILIGANQLTADYETWKDKLVREVKQSLDMWQAESRGKTPEKLVVTGAGFNFKDFGKYAGTQLGLASESRNCLNSVSKMPSSPSLSGPEYQAVSLTPLIGAAMAPENLDFNMVPDSVVLRKGLVDKAKGLTAFGILLMALLVSASLYGTLKLYFKQDTLDRLEQDRKAKEPAVQNVNKMIKFITVDRERRDIRFSIVSLLSEVHKLVPEGMNLDPLTIDVDRGVVAASGEANAMEDVQGLVNALEQSSLFKDVKENTKKNESGAGFRFQIECMLEK
jgi:Tfp pilus assembly PilM family ATPase